MIIFPLYSDTEFYLAGVEPGTGQWLKVFHSFRQSIHNKTFYFDPNLNIDKIISVLDSPSNSREVRPKKTVTFV